MISCNAADFLYRLLPVKPWRGFLIRVHFDRCPHCQKQLAGAAEARTLFVQEADFRPGVALWQGIAGSLAEEDGATPEKPVLAAGSRIWRWAAAGIIVAFMVGYWAWKDNRPDGVPVAASASARFELEYVRVGGQPADAYVYQPQGSDMIIVWAGKAN
ncbi:MAG: hypothetical protein A2W03_03660 [Candidatus Aminicenantes bacterium RBG_16_63_16]|nr:MAG: hypothetical protein A2W03_03660 [Candidatus Aminicenantes bacterium RBG_16_63_16]